MGWIDLQVNGYAGVDFNAPGLSADAVRHATERLNAAGTAGYLPTFVTGDPEVVSANMRVILSARRKYAVCERSILGFFLEGPFISPEPGAIGTHDRAWVRAPDFTLFSRLQDAAEGMIRMVNVAAELPGAADFISRVREGKVVVSLGHQMAKTPTELEPAISAGASAFTHLGNGLPNLIHRRENPIWEALADDRMKVMFIPDGHHLTDAMLKVYLRAVPLDRLIAVSDAQYPAGMPPGDYPVCGTMARLEPDGLLWNPERNCLVGATAPMAVMMDLLKNRIGATDAECRAIGHDNPLELIGGRGC